MIRQVVLAARHQVGAKSPTILIGTLKDAVLQNVAKKTLRDVLRFMSGSYFTSHEHIEGIPITLAQFDKRAPSPGRIDIAHLGDQTPVT